MTWLKISILTIVMLLTMPGSSRTCSLFVIQDSDGPVLGRNLDWEPMPGVLLVNPRGEHKTLVPWRGNWPAGDADSKESWVARYASVTFTCYGREFIESGMNEAGLMVGEASFVADYPPDDGRPGISCAQWLQHQLDRFATVSEVIEHLDDLRVDGEGWHYLIADGDGDWAAIEYVDGEALVLRGDGEGIPALTNAPYDQALEQLRFDRAFGGELDIASGEDSYARFVRIATLLRDYDSELHGSASDQAWRILDAVSVVDTQRSVVFDPKRMQVRWRTLANPVPRWLDLDRLDFSAGGPVRSVDLDPGTRAECSPLLSEFTVEMNRALVASVLDPYRAQTGTMRLLVERGLSFDGALDRIAGRRHAD